MSQDEDNERNDETAQTDNTDPQTADQDEPGRADAADTADADQSDQDEMAAAMAAEAQDSSDEESGGGEQDDMAAAMDTEASVSAHAGESSAVDQDDIDALMGETPTTDEDSPPEGQLDTSDPYAMLLTARSVGSTLPMLDVIFEQVTRTLSDSVRSVVSDIGDVEYKGQRNIKFADYRQKVSFPALLAVIDIVEWDEQILVQADTELVYSIVDIMLGGREAPPAKPEGRPYTDLEKELVGIFLERVLGELQQAFKAITDVTFRLSRFEDDPVFATITQESNVTAWATINIEISNVRSGLNFIIPYGSLEPIRDQLTQITRVSPGGSDRIWRRHFLEEAANANCRMTVELDTADLPAAEVMAWSPGCILELEKRVQDPVSILVNNRRVSTGYLAASERYYAVELADGIIEYEGSEDTT